MRKNLLLAQIAAMNLRLDWCSHEAAKYAVMHWHYSKAMPIGKLVKVGVWEDGHFVGVVIFSTGASPQLYKAYSESRFQVCELVRIALGDHVNPCSKIVSVSIRFLFRQSPGLRLIVSFADPEHGHHGGIYQAGNWVYVGVSTPGLYYELQDGTLTHNRNLQGPIGFGGTTTKKCQKQWSERLRMDLDSGVVKKVLTASKHKYLYPLDKAMRKQIEPLSKPYPKKCVQSDTGDTPEIHSGEGDSIST
jgi:hypothetical protein